MKLWIIDDSNKTASAVLEDEEVAALTECINAGLHNTNDNASPEYLALHSIALRLSKLGLQIEGL